MTNNNTLKEKKYPICPECGCNTLVGFTPPKEPIQSELLGAPEYVDWERAHLYCCNGETNCKYDTRFVDLTTPMIEPKYSLIQQAKEEERERIVEMIEEVDFMDLYMKYKNNPAFTITDEIMFTIKKDIINNINNK